MSENGTGLELLGFLGGTAKSKEAEAQKKLDQYGYLIYDQKEYSAKASGLHEREPFLNSLPLYRGRRRL